MKATENRERGSAGEHQGGAVKKGWPWKPLGEVCRTGSGGTPLSSRKVYYKGGNAFDFSPWNGIGARCANRRVNRPLRVQSGHPRNPRQARPVAAVSPFRASRRNQFKRHGLEQRGPRHTQD